MDENLKKAVANIMCESVDWQQAVSSKGDSSLIVYLDMKSPHAYISVRPTLQIVNDYKVEMTISVSVPAFRMPKKKYKVYFLVLR